MDERTLLALPRLTVVSGEPDFDLQQIARIIAHSVTIDGRGPLETLFGCLLAEVDRGATITPKTLDLIGHTRTSAQLLTLGDWVIDAAHPTTAAFFRGLAEHEVLPRLGVHALRLLGCSSAGTPDARATLCKLGDLLGLEVYGANQLLYAGHYDERGFRDCWQFLLVGASELCEGAFERGAMPSGDPYPRVLDIDALPAFPLGATAGSCPRRIVSRHLARQILQLVRRREGARMPGLLTAPLWELAMPSAVADAYHIAHVLLGGEFLRFFPDGPVGSVGMAADGIVFPVDDAAALRRLLAERQSYPVITR